MRQTFIPQFVGSTKEVLDTDLPTWLQRELVRPGDEKMLASLHRVVVGRTTHAVLHTPKRIYVEVLPTTFGGVLPPALTPYNGCWARISYSPDQGVYICHAVNLHTRVPDPYEIGASFHRPTLRSAVRIARQLVQRKAPPPPEGWLYAFLDRVPPLSGLFPTWEEVNAAFDAEHLCEIPAPVKNWDTMMIPAGYWQYIGRQKDIDLTQARPHIIPLTPEARWFAEQDMVLSGENTDSSMLTMRPLGLYTLDEGQNWLPGYQWTPQRKLESLETYLPIFERNLNMALKIRR